MLEGEPNGAGGGQVEIERGGVSGGVTVAAGGFDGAALAGALDLDIVGREGEVGFGLGAAEFACGGVVGSRRLLRRVEGSEPDAALLAGISDLRGVSPPRPLPHSPKVHLLHAAVAVTVAVHLNANRLISRRHNNNTNA